ncbi:S8 family peptidase [Peribacillus frigoritolerans]|uniref:S8 family peptidase n=1 Tax=Peribacillus castrilensis TaxID=2897690 RepID=A0AAW9N5V3_9BACI|nr:S8 family peptidase [Peribacillus castrilensis]
MIIKKYFFCIILIVIAFIAILFLVFNYKDFEKEEVSTDKIIPQNQWALINKGQKVENSFGIKNYDISAKEAWKVTKGDRKVIVGILDTGIDISNPNISDNIFLNQKEIEKNELDDEKNGFIDDINGWNFIKNDNSVYDRYLSDYHGTFIASLIVGKHDLNNNVWGVAPEVNILPLKFIDGSTGNTDNAIRAIEYAYKMGVRIINCSWDNTNFDTGLYDIMKKYKDILFISSSGNNQNNLKKTPVYPCSFELDNVVCVAAVNNTGKIYEYSGYGSEDLIYAPGETILGSLPENDYLYSSGASFATAYVTGVAALVISEFEDISSNDLAQILKISKKSVTNANADTYDIIDSKKALDKAKVME